MQDVSNPSPEIIGERYRILKKIGEGGMGEVYLAEHIHIEKRVAIKLLRPDVLTNQEAVIRFRQEARSASSIGHENIITIDDFGTMPDGRIYMAMEFLQGQALNDIVAQGQLQMPRALDILIQVTRALAAAHAKGITHRDMKPENIFVTQRDGRDVPKVLDFGIAKVSGADAGQNLTVAGAIFGTPFYMAPEQAMGATMDHRVDVYAMGVILYEIFCGTVPFKAESFMGILTQHITTEPVPPSQMAAQNGRIVPPELEAIILKAMRKNAADRYQSMNELSGALIDFHQLAVGGRISAGYPGGPSAGFSGGHSAGFSGGHSAGHAVARPTPSRKWLIPSAIGAVVVVAAVAVVALQGGSAPVVLAVPDAAPLAAVVPDAAVVVLTPPPPPDAAQIVVSAPDAAPVESAPALVSVTVRSEPSGAVVYQGNRRLGVTPLSLDLKPGESRRLKLARNMYEDAAVTVSAARGDWLVKLQSELRSPD
jgi:eukaryotic-like serine/threonine-protein kinase